MPPHGRRREWYRAFNTYFLMEKIVKYLILLILTLILVELTLFHNSYVEVNKIPNSSKQSSK